MFCFFGGSECLKAFDNYDEEIVKNTEISTNMHSCETLPSAPPAPPPVTGPNVLLELGKLIVRSRSASPAPRGPRERLLHAKLLAAKPSTSTQIQTQPKPDIDDLKPGLDVQLNDHVNALWHDQVPVCIEVLLAPSCVECRAAASRGDTDRQHRRALLLERWTMRAGPPVLPMPSVPLPPPWLLGAVRSQLHFSQLSAWRATLSKPDDCRRQLSREQCNIKKVEANCDSSERQLNIVYAVKTPDNCRPNDFPKPPTVHQFPKADLGNNMHLKVVLESLPRLDEIPTVKCTCQKRRPSKEVPPNIHEEITGKLNDLTLGTRKYTTDAINSNIGNTARRLSIVSDTDTTEYLITEEDDKKIVDDRMHTPCSENGKHKCNCDDESDGKENNKTKINETKKLDERRLKEIAKYKRRLRKEIKLKKLCDSTSSEGDNQQKVKETHTSIPILQASRFDRFRAIGCYRNQTYLTLPASRIESKSPFIESVDVAPTEFKKTNTIGTQTDELFCTCGTVLNMKCGNCNENRLVRSDANYNLASFDNETKGARRKCEDDGKSLKKHKCDNINNTLSDNIDFSINGVVKRPKLRRYFPIVDRLEKIVAERFSQKDIDELHLKTDDSVFSVAKQENKRQKTFSISDDDFVMYEKCDYGTFDKVDNASIDSPKDVEVNGVKVKNGVEDTSPSASEMDRFRWRFDSASSMVFHTKTGLPLTSSPAPLRRGNNCFDFDDSINGISGIKSALFPPPAPRPPPPPPRHSARLLGSFEESLLKGRLDPVAMVEGFSAELGASGAFCPPHRRLPVHVCFFAPGGTNAPYMGHINLGPSGYRVARSGTIQVSLFNPHGTLVKMFVVLYDLQAMPPMAKTFLRQRTLYMPAGADPPKTNIHKWLRYLIHLRFMTSKSGKLYLHTDIRIIVSRKADLDTATAHTLFKPIPTKSGSSKMNGKQENNDQEIQKFNVNCRPNRVFGGSSDFDTELSDKTGEIGDENQNSGVSYELRSFTYAPDNPKYSPR